MISSTPRITYKIGTRAGLGAVKDKSLPWLGSKAPSIEVAANFTGVYRILMGKGRSEAKTMSRAITKVLAGMTVWHGFGKQMRWNPAAGFRFLPVHVLSVSLLLLRVISS